MKLLASNCVFPTRDIHKTDEHYVEKLGSRRVDYLGVKEQHICLYRDGGEFILTQAGSQRVFPNREIYGYGEDAYVITESQQELQVEFEKNGVKIIQRLHKTDYHNLEFSIEDIDGRWICFGIKEA